MLGVEELSADDRRIVARARRLERFLTQPFLVTEQFTGIAGKSVTIEDTIKGCRAILAGDGDGWAESSFYMVGTFEDAREKENRCAQDATMISVDEADQSPRPPRSRSMKIPFATSAPKIRAALLVSNPAMRIFSPRFRSAS